MSDIELVIKISEDSYKVTCNGRMLPPNVENVVQGIKNGIPLPKGHGDLIDRNKLAHKMVIEDVSRFKEEPEALAGLFLRMCNKEKSIIEADKE